VIGADGAGAAHIYLGSAAPSAAGWSAAGRRIDLVDPLPGGAAASAAFGHSVASAGDVNGDGFGDFLVGAYGGAGAVYLYLGSAAPDLRRWNGAAAADRVDLAGGDGDGSTFGAALASAGDVDRDGYGDFLIGAAKADTVYLYFGTPSPTTSAGRRIVLSSPDGAAAFGASLSGAGDIDGDGYADFAIGAAGAGAGAGIVHLYLGSPAPSGNDWNNASPIRRVDLTNPDGAAAAFGSAVACAGDVNSDGYADLAITAIGAGITTGAAHLYLGLPTPSRDLWNGLTATWRMDLVSPDGADGLFGSSAAAAGDVNGDGYADFLIGAEGVGGGAGRAHLYLGMAGPNAVPWNAASSAKRVDLDSLDGPGAIFGSSLAGVGDLDGDGDGDFLISAHAAGASAGAVHLYRSAAMPTSALWNAADSPGRIDLASPNGAGGRFGIALAVRDPDARIRRGRGAARGPWRPRT
jgi:hypothetical protein